MTEFSAIILAAGKGTRMKSALPKPLHQLAHKPMLGYVVDAYKQAGAKEIVLVVAPDDALTPSLFPGCTLVVQKEQRGTGHAALVGLEGLTKKVGKVIVALGDQPFVEQKTIAETIAQKDAVTVVAMQPDDPLRYGRLVTNDKGKLLRIVEYKDATDEERKINLCNAFPICIDGDKAKDLLSSITDKNAANEFYFTDVVMIANERCLPCGYLVASENEAAAANSRAELADLEKIVQSKLRQTHMLNGATLTDPDSVFFAHDTKIGQDVIIEPNVFFGPGVSIANGTHIKANSYLEDTTIGEACEIGPFARIRSSQLAETARIGNFVEVSKSVLGVRATAKHLSYIGNAELGKKVNIGAGTIFCNYDGYFRHKAIIEDDVLIGSNNSIVAPVTIGTYAMTAAGSVIAKDVPSNALAIERSQQINKEDWAKTFRDQKKKEKEGK